MKNPIAPNTKIRILSPNHSEYVQKLAFDAGFKWCSYGREIRFTKSDFLFFRDSWITKSEDEHHFILSEELKEIFIDLPTEAELEQAESDLTATPILDDFIENVSASINETLEYCLDKTKEETIKKISPNKGQKHDTDKHSHYFKDVSDLDEVDVYRVCDLFEVCDNSGAIQHALKKLLCSGQRGAKGYRKDLEEARDSIQRKLDLMAEDGE